MDIYLTKEPANYKVLPVLLLMYMSVMLSSCILSNRLVNVIGHVTMAGALVAPLWFIFSDILAEVYGYSLARKVIIWAFVSQFIFSVICTVLANMPFPEYWQGDKYYHYVLDPILRVSISSIFAFILSGMINVYLLAKWKVLLKGRYFWLRSIGSSIIGELFFTCIAVITIQWGKVSWSVIYDIIFVSFSIKIICSIFISPIAAFFVNIIKKVEKTDVYEDRIFLNPLKWKGA